MRDREIQRQREESERPKKKKGERQRDTHCIYMSLKKKVTFS